MTMTIAGIDFEHHHYDERGDVLYLSRERYDGSEPPPTALSTPEGHNVEYDEQGRVTGLILVNVKWLLERDGELVITWPTGHLTSAELAPALVSAA